ncbi:hypothetical protein FDECE_8741 [Fusarium decemcellulare]|nr:hypothetical protein FDECE_8741 [Fusarium decemcellulare]
MKSPNSLHCILGCLVFATPFVKGMPAHIEPRVAVAPIPADNCGAPQPFFALSGTVGRIEEPICAAKWNKGTFPNSITAKATVNCLKWLKIGYTDGTEMILGGKEPGDDGHHRFGTVNWNPFVDTFAQFSLWDGGWDGGVGRMKIEMSNKCGGEGVCALDAGKYWDNPPDEYAVPRGVGNNGMLLGLLADQGECIDGLQAYFSNSKPSRVKLTDATFSPSFEELNQRPLDQRMMTAVQATQILHNQRQDAEVEMGVDLYLITETQLKGTTSSENSTQTDWQWGRSFKFELGIKAGESVVEYKPGGELSYSWGGQEIHRVLESTEDTELKRQQTRYYLSTKVKAGMRVQCTAVAVQGRVNLRYSATLEQIFESGDSYSYPVVGSFENAQSSQAITFCKDLAPEEEAAADALIITESGTYCRDGRRVGDTGMSDTDLLAACGV